MGITYLSLSCVSFRNGESCKKKKCPFRHTSTQEDQQHVEKTAAKEKVSVPVKTVEEPPQQPLQLRDIQQLPPFHFFTKAMFPMELLKRFEKQTAHPAQPEKFISIDYAFNKISNEQLDAWRMGHILQYGLSLRTV